MATDVDTFFEYMRNLTLDNNGFIFYTYNHSRALFTLGFQCVGGVGRMRASLCSPEDHQGERFRNAIRTLGSGLFSHFQVFIS